MARILYGVHGTLHGHAIRALTIARHYPEHDFLFVSHAQGAELLRGEFEVALHPCPDTRFRAHRVDTVSTLFSNLKFFSRYGTHRKAILKLIDDFQPDVAITDYEFLVPRAARAVGIPCLSLDHQHVITLCEHRIPSSQTLSLFATALAVRCLFSRASDYMVISFFRPSVKHSRVRLVPPLLRESVFEQQAREGEHVLFYQNSSTHDRFLPLLKKLDLPVRVYGFGAERTEGNLQFKAHSERGFLKDLAECRYVIGGGGHSLISEALFYRKPVVSIPMGNAFEQFLNAFYLEKLAYGIRIDGLNGDSEKIVAFEKQLDRFRANIGMGNFNGNPEVYAILDYFIRERRMPPASSS